MLDIYGLLKRDTYIYLKYFSRHVVDNLSTDFKRIQGSLKLAMFLAGGK